jgi:hypothetical protein
LDRRKAVEDLLASHEVISGNIELFSAGKRQVYRVIAVELRKLLFDGPNSLIPRLFPQARLHPHRSYRPGEDLNGLVFQLPGIWNCDGTGAAVLVELFDRRRPPIDLDEWRRQPLMSQDISLADFVRSVADKEGAHSDAVYNHVLLLARSVRVAAEDMYSHMIVGIGRYVAETLEEVAIPQIPVSMLPSRSARAMQQRTSE